MTASPAAPVLLRSLQSSVLLDGRGDVEFPREARGATAEWGGVYGQLVRLTGPWRISVGVEGQETPLPASQVSASFAGELFESRHICGAVEVVQLVAPLADVPGAVRSITCRAPSGSPAPIVVTSTFEPYLLPVLVEGIRPVRFELERAPGGVAIRHRGFEMEWRSDVPAASWFVDGVPWTGEKFVGPIRSLRSVHPLPAGPAPATVGFEIVGGLQRSVKPWEKHHQEPIPEARAVAAGLASEEAAWADATPDLEFPDAPGLTEGYRLARAALRRLYTSPGDELTGLVAGFPWYAAIWCRDVAWMLPAVAWMGDRAWAERSVTSVLRYQALADVPVVGGETGELPMQVAPGPIFFYGTSDTTLYYPAIVQRLVRLGLSAPTLSAWRPALERALAWGRRRTDPRTGLLRHGGEAAELARATESIARIRYGIDALDTTIWDSTDRRDHAIDVQVLWHDALRAAADLGLDADGGRAATADRLAATLRERYWWAEENYLFDSIRSDAPVRKIRPNALRAVSAGLIEPDRARAVVARAARPDLSADWGLRTLSSLDPSYSPEAYHDGQVWPIATAWAADAALAVGDAGLGVDLLTRIAEAMRREGGQANECYRGDRAEPFDSCFLLGLSIGPFLTTLFERLWGLTVDARVPSLSVRPTFPASWKSASLRRLAIGPSTVDLELAGGAFTATWHGDTVLTLATRSGTVRLGPRSAATVALEPAGAR
jgi:glycogen debranching enzyme